MSPDEFVLADMLVAARKAREFVDGLSFEEFEASDLHQNAVVRALEVVGEAARRVSDETRNAHPSIPWRPIIGMRNRLMHEYFRVDLEEVWRTVTTDIPQLVELLSPLVPPEDHS